MSAFQSLRSGQRKHEPTTSSRTGEGAHALRLVPEISSSHASTRFILGTPPKSGQSCCPCSQRRTPTPRNVSHSLKATCQGLELGLEPRPETPSSGIVSQCTRALGLVLGDTSQNSQGSPRPTTITPPTSLRIVHPGQMPSPLLGPCHWKGLLFLQCWGWSPRPHACQASVLHRAAFPARDPPQLSL